MSEKQKHAILEIICHRSFYFKGGKIFDVFDEYCHFFIKLIKTYCFQKVSSLFICSFFTVLIKSSLRHALL